MGLSISGLKARVLQPHGSLRSRLLSFLIPGIWWLQGPELLFCRRKLLLKEQNRRIFHHRIPDSRHLHFPRQKAGRLLRRMHRN